MLGLGRSRGFETPRDRPLNGGGLCSVDHLVGAQQNRWGYGKAERRGGLAVHDHLELGRELHREIARLFAAQDAIDIGGGATKEVYPVTLGAAVLVAAAYYAIFRKSH